MSAELLPGLTLTRADQDQLLGLARRSIEHGLQYRRPLPVTPAQYPPPLQEPWGVFVTLRLERNLRGCIGTLEPEKSLVENVVQYAFFAAFSDSRFPELTRAEFDLVRIQISVIGRLEPMIFHSEADLLRQLEPGVDGLILEAGGHRGTFLPSVWECIPDKTEFLNQLKRKAGLPPDFAIVNARLSRYRAFCFGEA